MVDKEQLSTKLKSLIAHVVIAILLGRISMSDFKENVKGVKNKANDLFDTAKETTSEAYHKTKSEADKLASQINDTAEDAFDNVLTTLTTSIRKQPLTSVVIAAGIGYLYAKLFK